MPRSRPISPAAITSTARWSMPIASHHGEVEPNCIEAIIVQAADTLSATRPGARREVLETYVKRLEKLEEIANSFAGVTKSYAIQAGREIRIILENVEMSDAQVGRWRGTSPRRSSRNWNILGRSR